MKQARELLKESDIDSKEAQGTILDEGYERQLEEKWNPLLEGVNDSRIRRNTAKVLENQSEHLKESGLAEQTGGGTGTGDVGPFKKFVFPIIRRSLPELIANEVVSVQPLNGPVGAIFFYRILYENDKGEIQAGDEFPLDFSADYSSEYVNSEQIATGDGSTTDFQNTLDWTPVRPNTVQVSAGTQNLADNGGGNLDGDGGGSVSYEDGRIEVSFDSAPASDEPVEVSYQVNMEGNPQMPSIRFDLDLTAVEAETRHLKTLWSAEAAEDYRALHGRNVEEDLVDSASREVQTEIDRKIIEDLFQLAIQSGNSAVFDADPPSGSMTQTEHLRDLIIKINQVSQEIRNRSFAGGANWLIVHPDVAALFDATPFWDTEVPDNNRMEGGIIKIGVLRKKWDVYIDPYLQDRQKIIVGRQGDDILDTGYIYAPYVPLQISQTFMDPDNWQARKAFRTRDSRNPIKPSYYGYVQVENI